MKIRLAYDQGSSLTKVIYRINEAQPVALVMGSEIMSLPVQTIAAHRETAIGAALPENDAWITQTKRADNAIVFGHLARQFDGEKRLRQLKYEQGAYKLQAVIGAIVQREELDPDDLKVEITALMPLQEYSSQGQLLADVEKNAKNYYFRNQRLNVTVSTFDCVPEGGGFVVEKFIDQGKEWLANRLIVVLMLGHRNSSLLLFEKGSISRDSDVNDTGFTRLIQSVIGQTALGKSDQDLLTKSIFNLGREFDLDNINLRVLANAYKEHHFEQEVEDIATAIRAARVEYWNLLKTWLTDHMPKELDQLIIAGGAAPYLKPELTEFFDWADPIFAEQVDPEFEHLFDQFPDRMILETRFRDVSALFRHTWTPSYTGAGK